jgi:hypothetical protein
VRKPYRSELAGRLVVRKRTACFHYEEKVGLPTSCIGEMRHYVTRVTVVEEKVPYFIYSEMPSQEDTLLALDVLSIRPD